MNDVRGFNHVFSIERRVYSLAGIRLPGAGVPLSALVVFVAGVSVCALARRVPGFGDVWSLAPWPVRLVVVPAAGAFCLTRIRVEGRVLVALLLPVTGFVARRGGDELVRHWARVRALVAPPAPERSSSHRPQLVCGPASVLLLRPYREEPRRRRTRIYVHVEGRRSGRVRLEVPRGRSVELIETR